MDRISVSSTISGLVIGTFVLCANFQFGLQTGWVSMMSMPAALLGFAWFRTLRQQLTAQENVYIQSVAVAVGTGPLSFGLVGAVPAIQLLLTDEEGRTSLNVPMIMLWSLGIGFIGIFTALLLREMIISDRTMTFPSGSAAAALIGVLHNKPLKKTHYVEEEEISDADSERYADEPEVALEEVPQERPQDEYMASPDNTTTEADASPTYRRNIIVLVVMFAFSSVYTLLNKMLSFLRAIPLFGPGAAQYMWQFEFSPAYVGRGIVMGLPTTASMMLGAIVGWAMLAPLAKSMEWAPGPIDDWQTGAQGWIMWVSLAIMVADTGVSFVLLTVNSLKDLGHKIQKLETQPEGDQSGRFLSRRPSESQTRDPVGGQVGSQTEGQSEMPDSLSVAGTVNIESPQSQWKTALLGLLVSSVLCIVCINILFGEVPTLALIIAVGMSPLLSLLGVRALGETDLNPVSSIAKLTQFVFGIMMHSKPHSVLLNIVAGAITEAGAQQAGDLMQDYKTGGLLGALMTHQTIGMVVGTIWSVIVSGFVYHLYNERFTIPGPEFRIPTAYIWADCARLMTGKGLPPRVGVFALSFAALFVAIAVVKQVLCKHKKWVKWLPSGVAVGIGMYNVPSFTISRFIGGLIAFWYQRRCHRRRDEVYLVILSSGLILGEGITSVALLLAAI